MIDHREELCKLLDSSSKFLMEIQRMHEGNNDICVRFTDKAEPFSSATLLQNLKMAKSLNKASRLLDDQSYYMICLFTFRYWRKKQGHQENIKDDLVEAENYIQDKRMQLDYCYLSQIPKLRQFQNNRFQLDADFFPSEDERRFVSVLQIVPTAKHWLAEQLPENSKYENFVQYFCKTYKVESDVLDCGFQSWDGPVDGARALKMCRELTIKQNSLELEYAALKTTVGDYAFEDTRDNAVDDQASIGAWRERLKNLVANTNLDMYSEEDMLNE